jgi:tetrathionate reductase subunit B
MGTDDKRPTLGDQSVDLVKQVTDHPTTRAGLLKALGLAAAGLAAAGVVDRLGRAVPALAESPAQAKTKERLAMVIDLRKCIGCSACSVSCKQEYEVPVGVFRSWVKIVEKGTYPNVRKVALPRLCNHCDNPACVEVCPVQASYRADNGAVLIHTDKCIGCKYCIAACPYDARFINPETKTADKCTFCVHRVEKGQQPACVTTCMAKARTFGDLNDPNSELAKLVATQPVQVLKPALGTEPQVYYIGLDEFLESENGEGGFGRFGKGDVK